ncbi:MAG: DUF6115 domain-containing protein, partial [Lachnospiraceae bacterium]|nr:DUF6115 domain-containing protein [Lachnospiraceae bacterium]
MSGIQITLLIAGVIIFIFSFFLPAGKPQHRVGKADKNDLKTVAQDEVKLMVEKELEEAKAHINEIVDETITYAMEKAERAMERITNEKIMAINEYSDTVLKEIHKNQQEVIFLYDMLTGKHDAMLELVSEATVLTGELKQVKNMAVSAEKIAYAKAEKENHIIIEDSGDVVVDYNDDTIFTPFIPPQISANDQRILWDNHPATIDQAGRINQVERR